MKAAAMIARLMLLCVLGITAVHAQSSPADQPSFVTQGQQLIREGKLDEALSLYRTVLKAIPDSEPANTGAGTVLDLMGKGEEARHHFQKAIDVASDDLARSKAQRAMAMSWAFAGNCDQTLKYEQLVMQYFIAQKDFYQQGEIADEAARVCLDAGQFDIAYQWYLTGHDLGLKQPDITDERKNLWAFRWEHAQARIAARKGNQSEAAKHVTAAKAILDKDDELAKTQSIFLPYLLGYVSQYRGDHEAAIAELQKANVNDPYIQCLMGDAYDALRQKDKAIESYAKAAAATGHNPPTAYARPYASKKLAALAKKE